MKLNVDFTALRLATAQINGFLYYLNEIKILKIKYNEGLKLAISFVHANSGHVIQEGDNLILTFGGCSVRCRNSNLSHSDDIFDFSLLNNL